MDSAAFIASCTCFKNGVLRLLGYVGKKCWNVKGKEVCHLEVFRKHLPFQLTSGALVLGIAKTVFCTFSSLEEMMFEKDS